MFRIDRTSATADGGTKVTCRAGEVRIQSRAVFARSDERWRSFVERMWRIPDVEAVHIDRQRGTASVRFAKGVGGNGALLERMGAALALPAAFASGSPVAGLAEHLEGRRSIRLFRRGGAFSTWELIHELPGRIRVRDIGLRGRTDLVRRLELDLHTLPGVHTVTASPTSGSVLVRFDPAVIDRDSMLAALDEAVRSPDLSEVRDLPARVGFTLANTTLALATIGEFMFPAVLPASAILLVATNLPAFRGAWHDLRERRLGLPLLQTSIVAGTLATGGFIASSLMSWLMLFWQNRHARRVATARQILGASVRKQHRTAWVCRDGVELETPANRLQPGQVISVRAGDMLPADGRVISGTAMVDESVVRGTEGLVCRTIEHSILRGALVVEGELQVEVVRCGDDTVAERIGQALDAATRETALSLKHAPPVMAQRAVSPALLTAGVGLMVGDATTAVAILRPDYATGLGIGGSLLLVHQLGSCLQSGLIVRQARVFAEMARVDMLLIDRHPALERRETVVAGIIAPGNMAADDLLTYAESALRGVCDPRAAALSAACAERGLAPIKAETSCSAGHIDLWDGARHIRIDGLARTAPADDEEAAAPIDLSCDGVPAGSIEFRFGEAPAARQAVSTLRAEHKLQVGVLASSPLEEASRAGSLPVDFHHVCETDADKAQFIADCRRAGHRVAYVGDCRSNPLAAEAADVAIAPVAEPGDESDPAEVWMLQDDYSRIGALCEIARASRRNSQMHHGMTLIPNLTCVAGAFLFGFTSLAAVIISNFATYTVYKRSVAELHQTERRLLGRRRPRRLLDAAHVQRRIPQDSSHG